MVWVMTSGGALERTSGLAYDMDDQAIRYYRRGAWAAIAVVLFAIMLVYIVFQLRRLLRNEQ